MQTTQPATADSDASRRSPNGTPLASGAPDGGAGLGLGTTAVVLAVLALVVASVAIVFADGGDTSTSVDGTGSATVELSEFALTPAALTVQAGGAIEVTNTGSVAHNLAVSDTDLATADLAAGESETLDLSSLEPGEYEIICLHVS